MTTQVLEQATLSDTERKLRVDLANFYHLVEHFGWSEMIFNHISVRLPGRDAYLVNPFGLNYSEITPDNLLTVDVNGELMGEAPYPANPAGFALHGVIHMNRHDVGCVAHTHTNAVSAVASPCLSPARISLGSRVSLYILVPRRRLASRDDGGGAAGEQACFKTSIYSVRVPQAGPTAHLPVAPPSRGPCSW